MRNKKVFSVLSFLFAFSFFAITPAFAHVVVKPSEVGIAAFQTFTMGVPVEKDIATTSMRLVIPDGLNYVTPNVKPGWKIDIKKDGTGEDAKVTEINWTGGSIPAGQRDDFIFSAQAPKSPTTLMWKAYQTYADGSVVSWDQDPTTIQSGEEGNPYSKTNVVNDLNTTPKDYDRDIQSNFEQAGNATIVGYFGILFGLIGTAIGLTALRKKVK